LIYYLNQGILIKSIAWENAFIKENMPKGGLFEDEKQIIKTSKLNTKFIQSALIIKKNFHK